MKSAPLLATLVLFNLAVVSAIAEPRRPNVIVIMTDDQGYGDFSFNGNPIARTPNIDRLASESLRLTDFHVAPMCTPTRGQLMTGIDAFRNAAMNVSSGRSLLDPSLKTMADIFRKSGYRTGLFGKWHLGDNFPFRPGDRGFDEAVWFPSSHINSVPDFWNNDYFDDTYMHNGTRQQYKGYCTDVFFREAMEWIEAGSTREKPFFLYIAPNAAHWPHFVPDRYREPVRERMRQNPESVRHLPEHVKEQLVSFLAMGANIDENIGKLERHLTRQGLRDNTILVFLTDNGSTFGPDYFNAGMRGKKTSLWEGGHRVPCLIRWLDGDLISPRDLDELSQVQDLLPTLADLAGITTASQDFDGRNLAPIFKGEQTTLGDRMLVINYSRMPQFKVSYTDGNPALPWRDGAAVLWRRWRLIENRELYDLLTDPLQENDVAAQFPGVVARMRAHLEAWWKDVEPCVREPQRVIIGSDAENPTQLTACEWLDVFIDQQQQVRRGELKRGSWHLDVAEAGTYRFTCRRWPEESGLKLTDPAPEAQVTDGTYLAGQALPITGAFLRIQGQPEQSTFPAPGAKSVDFVADLSAGPIQLEATFTGPDGKPLLGAYYLKIERL